MAETFKTIGAWGIETFNGGEPCDRIAVAFRMNREVSELGSAISNQASRDCIEDELADLGIFLAQIGHSLRASLKQWEYSAVVDSLDFKVPEKGYIVDNSNEYAWGELTNKESFKFKATQSYLIFMETFHRALYHEITDINSTGYYREVLWRRCFLHLTVLSKIFSVSLWPAVERKMAVNRQRKWERNKNGSFQHVEVQASPNEAPGVVSDAKTWGTAAWKASHVYGNASNRTNNNSLRMVFAYLDGAPKTPFPELSLPVRAALMAQLALESGWGKSDLAVKYHNYGGMKWRDWMSDVPGAIQIKYRAHDGVDNYLACSDPLCFATVLSDKLSKIPYAVNWSRTYKTPEDWIRPYAETWAPKQNYAAKVSALAKTLLDNK